MYLTQKENLKLPFHYKIFPRIFQGAIHTQIAEASHIKPTAFGKYTYLLKNPLSIDGANKKMPENFQLQIYGLDALLMYSYSNYSIDSNPQIYTLTYSRKRYELLNLFDNIATDFGEHYSEEKTVKLAVVSARELLIRAIDMRIPQVFQLGAFNINLRMEFGKNYQVVRRV